jgi:hypothetical protein
MSLDIATGEHESPRLALQFINIEIAPLMSGRLGIAIQATLLDEQELEFIGQELVQTSADSLEGAIAVIRESAGLLDARLSHD